MKIVLINSENIMGRILVLCLIATALTSCGPRYFEGSEVNFKQDDTVFEFTTDDKIDYRADSENSGIYRITIRNEDLDIGELDEDGELTLGFPSDELTSYYGESVHISREIRIGFEDVEYVDHSYECDANSTIEITSNEYGLLAGKFSAYLCKYFDSEPGPARMLIAGTFAGTVEESRW
jgi:hypothetical protein